MIQKVMSYMGAWEHLLSRFPEEIDELKTAIHNYISGSIVLADDERSHPRNIWEKALFDQGWDISEQSVFTNTGRKRSVRFLGPQRNGLAAQIGFNNPDFLSRWLFNYATIGVRNNLVEVPILVVPMANSLSESDKQRAFSRMGTFEYYQDQLEMLSPLSIDHPFLILGFSNEDLSADIEVTNLEGSERNNSSEANVIINKSIEFPSEYHQAGIGILNFFSTYLNENYPSQNATVKIEQNGLKVRMVVESADGKSEIIEKALHEYELIMSGSEKITKFTNNDKLILDLRNEVRVANFRIESQQDIIALQNNKLQSTESRIDILLSLVGEGLKKESHAINVQVNPCIQNNMSMTINSDVSSSLGCLEELGDLMPKDDEVCLPILDLSKALQKIEAEKEPDVVRSSSAMAKFGRFIDKISDTNSAIRKTIDTTQQGIDIAVDLVNKYNKIASWCGLASVPMFS